MDTLVTKTFHGKVTNMFKFLRNIFSKDKNSARAKDAATARNEPYVRVVDVNFDSNQPGKGYFELDWNKPFVATLIQSGYEGNTEEDIVDAWFTNLCRNIADEEY